MRKEHVRAIGFGAGSVVVYLFASCVVCPPPQTSITIINGEREERDAGIRPDGGPGAAPFHSYDASVDARAGSQIYCDASAQCQAIQPTCGTASIARNFCFCDKVISATQCEIGHCVFPVDHLNSDCHCTPGSIEACPNNPSKTGVCDTEGKVLVGC